MIASTVALVGALVYAHRLLLPVLAEHLDDNDGEVLPHLLLSDIVRWLVERRGDSAQIGQIWAWLEAAYIHGDEDERDLIATSAVEMIPDPEHPGSEMRSMLGPALRAVDPWQVRQFGHRVRNLL